MLKALLEDMRDIVASIFGFVGALMIVLLVFMSFLALLKYLNIWAPLG